MAVHSKYQPAFPIVNPTGEFNPGEGGLSKLEYIATEVLKGLLYSPAESEPQSYNYELLAKCAVKAANALLIELDKY